MSERSDYLQRNNENKNVDLCEFVDGRMGECDHHLSDKTRGLILVKCAIPNTGS